MRQLLDDVDSRWNIGIQTTRTTRQTERNGSDDVIQRRVVVVVGGGDNVRFAIDKDFTSLSDTLRNANLSVTYRVWNAAYS